MESDRISSLPDDVTEKILSRLPIRDAVRTSVLSTKWIYKSAMLQDLEFDESNWRKSQNPGDDDDQNGTNFANMVDHVLLLHIGPIRKFKLFVDRVDSRNVDRWLTRLSRNSIKELVLNFWIDQYKIPFCLFSCQDLVHLELNKSFMMDPTLTELFLKPPSRFKGFRNLKSLQLVGIDMTQAVFENLICGCPLLEKLIFQCCFSVCRLKFDAPKLKFIDIFGCFYYPLELGNTSNFTDVSIGMTLVEDSPVDRVVSNSWIPSSSTNLLKIFDQLLLIQRLKIQRFFLKYLSLGGLPEKLPRPCLYLNDLSIDICFDDLDEVSTALCLLRSSPALQELEISMSRTKKLPMRDINGEEVKSSCLSNKYNCTFSQLKLLKIIDISGAEGQLDFIRFLLLKSPLLERMTVKPSYSVCDTTNLVKELLKFKRDSKRSEIILLDP